MHSNLNKTIASLQSKIDSLMLEHCPEEMSPEQITNWEQHQQVVINEEQTLENNGQFNEIYLIEEENKWET